MLATVLEVLSLLSIPLGLLLLGAAFVAFLIDARWHSTTAYLEDGPPRALHWITQEGQVFSRPLADGDPLTPSRGDKRSVYYREEDPHRIRLHRRSEPFRVLRLSGLLLTGIGAVFAIASFLLSLLVP